MFKKAAMMFLYAEHPVHAGSGNGVGAIDLPIQRERVTNWPIIQPSGLKGALREHYDTLPAETTNEDPQYQRKVFETFGPESGAEYSGAVSFTEAKVLFFPVRSLKGTFAYVTCPLALLRFQRDLETIRFSGGPDLLSSQDPRPDFPNVGDLPDENTVLVSRTDGPNPHDNSLLLVDGANVVFEELLFTAKSDASIFSLAEWLGDAIPNLPWLDVSNFVRRIAVVHDDVFKDFVEMSTEVITRNKINKVTGTVENGALWTEEHLPRETVLYSTIFVSKPFASTPAMGSALEVLNFINNTSYQPRYLWVGGDTTLGRGLVQVSFVISTETGGLDADT